MAAETYRVEMPYGNVGHRSFFNILFEDGVATGVPKGMALDEFKDWGCTITLENPPPPKRVLTEDEVERVAKQVANAHKRAKAPVGE